MTRRGSGGDFGGPSDLLRTRTEQGENAAGTFWTCGMDVFACQANGVLMG